MTAPSSVVSLVEMLENSVRKYGARDLFGTRRDGRWVYVTYAEFARQVDDLRAGLSSLGVGSGDKVGIIANNRIEWAAAAYATYGLGAAFVAMYESQLERDWEFIVRDAELKVLFVANAGILKKTQHFREQIPSLRHFVVMGPPDASPAPEGAVGYADLMQKGATSPAPALHPAVSEIASLLYTSGTTGNPKGVMLSHANIVSNVTALGSDLPMGPSDRSLAFLPWAHSAGHTCELHLMISIGASMGICETTDKILDYLAEVKPSILFAVPRLFNKLRAGVEKQMESRPAPVRALFRAGLRAAIKKKKGQPLGPLEASTLALADNVVFSKVRARFGGNLKLAVSGAAALSKEVAEYVDALGVALYEGYGLTETSPIVSVNLPGQCKIGSVGRAIPGVRVEIDRSVTGDAVDGEIIVHGPNVMRGYHNLPEETASVLTAEGAFRTGDMGHLDSDGYLFITGRIKEQYKLENGKYVVPSPLEESLKLSPFVANVMVYGENKPFNVALVVPNLDALKEWATAHGLGGNATDALLSNPSVRAKIKGELDSVSTHFKGYERIFKFALIAEDFTQANDMLTPKLSVKRRNVIRKWGRVIEQLYV
jgi:long-chain acyl-CoA synthetase